MKRDFVGVMVLAALASGCVKARAIEAVRADHAQRFSCPGAEIRIKPLDMEPHEEPLYFAQGCEHDAIYVCRFARCVFFSEQFFRARGLSSVRRKSLLELKAERPDLVKLADDYQHKVVDEQESLAIRERIRTLDLDSAFVFHEIMRSRARSADEKLMFDAVFEYAIAHGKSPYDLSDADMIEVSAEVIRRRREMPSEVDAH